MPKLRTNNELPKRLFYKHGAYYYVTAHKRKNHWRHLGFDKLEAMKIAKELNDLKTEERFKTMEHDRAVLKEISDQVMSRDGYKCTYCDSKTNLGLDHVIPFSKGGSNNSFNLVACCSSCNYEKKDQNPIIFLLKKSGFFVQIMDEILNRIRQNQSS